MGEKRVEVRQRTAKIQEDRKGKEERGRKMRYLQGEI